MKKTKVKTQIRFVKATDIKSHADACKVLGKDPKATKTTGKQQVQIATAMNKLAKFKADFENSDQKKWYGIFLINKNGFGFSLSLFGHWHSTSDAGARLCFYFATQEDAEHFCKHFLPLHKKHFYGNKLK